MKTDDSDLEVGHAMSGPSQEIQSTEWLDQPTGPGWWWYFDKYGFGPEIARLDEDGMVWIMEFDHADTLSNYPGKWLGPIPAPTPPQ